MKSSSFRLYLVDFLCVLLFSLGSALIVFPWLGHSVPSWTLFFLIVLIALFFSLGLIRLWLPAVLLVTAALFLTIGAWFTGRIEEWFSYWNGFFPWCFSGMAQHPVYSNDVGNTLTYLFLLCPIVLFYIVCLRRFFSIWILSLIAAAGLIFQGIIRPDELLFPFLLLCAALMICLPRVRLKSDGRLRAQFLAALFVLPILLLSLWIAPAKDGEWTSASVQHLVHDLEDWWEYHWGKLPDLPIASMRGTAWMPLGDTLGGDVELDSDTLFTIETNSPFLLRGEILNFYTGSSWQDMPDEKTGNFRMDSLLWQDQRRQAFGLALPSDTSAISFLMGQVTLRIDSRIRCIPGYRSLMLPYRAESVQYGGSRSDLYFNTQGETYIDSPPSYSYSYQVKARAWNPYSSDFDSHMLNLETLARNTKDPGFEEAAAANLQIPESLPMWVAGLCSDLTRDAGSPYAKAIALRDYLANTCEYTLTPGEPEPGQDFVASFLQAKKGYCVYYASALTVLCRLAEIPARYVTGYGMIRDAEHDSYKATQATGHAWTEIYLYGIGWIPLDALNQSVFLLNSNLPEEEIPVNPLPENPESPEQPEEDVPEPSEETPSLEKQSPSNPWTLLWIPPVLFCILIFLYYGMTYYFRRYTLSFVQKRCKSAGDAADYYYRDLLRQLRLFGVQPQGGDTLLSLGQRADRHLPPELDISVSQISQTMNRLRYGELLPSEKDIHTMNTCHERIERHLRKVLGFWGYFFRRFLATWIQK